MSAGAMRQIRRGSLALCLVLGAAPARAGETDAEAPPELRWQLPLERAVLGETTSLPVELVVAEALRAQLGSNAPRLAASTGELVDVVVTETGLRARYVPPARRLPSVAVLTASWFADDGTARHAVASLELVARISVTVRAPLGSRVRVQLPGDAPLEALLGQSTSAAFALTVPRGTKGYAIVIAEPGAAERHEWVELGLTDQGVLSVGPAPPAAWTRAHHRIELAVTLLPRRASALAPSEPGACRLGLGEEGAMRSLTPTLHAATWELEQNQAEPPTRVRCTSDELEAERELEPAAEPQAPPRAVATARPSFDADTRARPLEPPPASTRLTRLDPAPSVVVTPWAWPGRTALGLGWARYGDNNGNGSALALAHATGPGPVRLLANGLLTSCSQSVELDPATTVRDEWWTVAGGLGLSVETPATAAIAASLGFGVGAVAVHSRASATRAGLALQPAQESLLVAPQHTLIAELGVPLGDVAVTTSVRWVNTLAFNQIPSSSAWVGTLGVSYAPLD